MLELSRGRMTKSGVVDIATGGSTTSDIRTSTGTFISRKRDDVIARIEKRIELWSHVPETHGAVKFQVLRYQHGQEYKAHFDYFFHKSGMRNNRIATVLLYLSDVEEGGRRCFRTRTRRTNRAATKFSECGNLGRGIKARKGDALLFWSMKPGGELDPGSSHAGCPVIKGENGRRSGCTSTRRSALRAKTCTKSFTTAALYPRRGATTPTRRARDGHNRASVIKIRVSCTNRAPCRVVCVEAIGETAGTKSQASPPRRRQTKTSHCLHTEYCTNNESCVARRTTRRHVVFFSVANRRRATKKNVKSEEKAPRHAHSRCVPKTHHPSSPRTRIATINTVATRIAPARASRRTGRARRRENVPRTARRRKINASVFLHQTISARLQGSIRSRDDV